MSSIKQLQDYIKSLKRTIKDLQNVLKDDIAKSRSKERKWYHFF